MSLKDAFNNLLGIQKRPAVLRRRGSPDIFGNINYSPTFFFRRLEGTGAVVQNREIVISKDQVIKLTGFSAGLRRGDIIQDTELGDLVIDQIIEMFDLGGAIIGFRCFIK